jgi:hypothetical protein
VNEENIPWDHADEIIEKAFAKAQDPDLDVDDMRQNVMVKALGAETIIFHEGMPYISWTNFWYALHVASRAMGAMGVLAMADEINKVVVQAMKVRDNGPQKEAD